MDDLDRRDAFLPDRRGVAALESAVCPDGVLDLRYEEVSVRDRVRDDVDVVHGLARNAGADEPAANESDDPAFSGFLQDRPQFLRQSGEDPLCVLHKQWLEL